jgi:hypothetical protein
MSGQFIGDVATITARNALVMTDADAAVGTRVRAGGDIYTCVAGTGAAASAWSGKNNMAATAAPAVTDDTDLGYKVGSYWYDTTNDKAYVCLDASDGAAVWAQTTLRASDSIATLAATDWFYAHDDSDSGDPIEKVPASVIATFVGTQNNIVAGAWSDTAVAGTNVAGIGTVTGHYIRVGDRVHFAGEVASVNPTAAAPSATDFEIPLPVASNFGATTDASGCATSASAFEFGTVTASVANNTLVVNCSAVADTTQSVFVTGSYKVI